LISKAKTGTRIYIKNSKELLKAVTVKMPFYEGGISIISYLCLRSHIVSLNIFRGLIALKGQQNTGRGATPV
jgi:hypothetical protein